MSALPRLYLVRHGDTEWSETHRHTGRTDVPLNEEGERRARQLAEALPPVSFKGVFTSPLKRAARTCALAGFGDVAEFSTDLLEWDYGSYEGKLTSDIRKDRPGWELFRDGCPTGESARDVAIRADRFITGARELGGDVLAFSSGHIIRMIAAGGSNCLRSPAVVFSAGRAASASSDSSTITAMNRLSDYGTTSTCRRSDHQPLE